MSTQSGALGAGVDTDEVRVETGARPGDAGLGGDCQDSGWCPEQVESKPRALNRGLTLLEADRRVRTEASRCGRREDAANEWLRLGRQGQDRRKQFNPGSTVKAEPAERADRADVWDEKGRRQGEVKAHGLSSEKGGVAITHNGGGGGGQVWGRGEGRAF